MVEALDGDRFLILPHPEVADYYPPGPPTRTAGWAA